MIWGFKRKWWCSLVASLLLSILLAACGNKSTGNSTDSLPSAPGRNSPSGPKKGGTLKVALANEPVTLSTLMSGGDASLGSVSSAIFDPLFHIDYKTSEIKPGLGLSWEAKTPTSYIVKLRQGVQFQKGYGEMTAEDVAFSYNVTIKNNLRSIFALNFLKEVKVVDPQTVEFVLEKPYSPFVITSLTYANMVISKKAYEELGAEKFNRTPVGAGPFEVVDWVPGNRISLKKFENYWQRDKGLPYLDRIEFLVVKDPFVRINMLKTKQVDIIDSPDLKDLPSLEKEQGIKVQSVPGHNWDYITFNLTRSDHPFSKPQVRQAVNYALDRGAIIQDVYYGYATATDISTPPGFVGARQDRMYGDKPDVEKAKQLLAQAGYADGFEVSVITSDKANLRRELEIVVGQLAKVGIRVKIQGLDLGTFNQRTLTKPKDFIMALEDINVVSPDPDSTMFWFHYPDTTSNHGYDNKQVNELLEQGRALSDPKERQKVYERVHDIIREENPFIYIAHVNQVQAIRDYVMNSDVLPVMRRHYTDTWLNK